MTRLVQAELLKLLSTRLLMWLGLLTLALVALLLSLTAANNDAFELARPGHQRDLVAFAAVSALVALILGIVASAGEYAHKTISHTGELLRRGTVIASVALLVLVLAVMAWALRLTHRIVRPVHTLHRALDALVAGELGVRVELHRQDEFREVGEVLNRLIEEFATTLGRAHALVDRIAALTAAAAQGAHDQATEAQLRALVEELDQTMEFFRLEPPRTLREDDG